MLKIPLSVIKESSRLVLDEVLGLWGIKLGGLKLSWYEGHRDSCGTWSIPVWVGWEENRDRAPGNAVLSPLQPTHPHPAKLKIPERSCAAFWIHKPTASPHWGQKDGEGCSRVPFGSRFSCTQLMEGSMKGTWFSLFCCQQCLPPNCILAIYSFFQHSCSLGSCRTVQEAPNLN